MSEEKQPRSDIPGLAIDVYPGDPPVDWSTYVHAGRPWIAAILKATEGMRIDYVPWLTRNLAALMPVADDRLAHDFFLGFYHFLDLDHGDGGAQAEHHCSIVESVWTPATPFGQLWGMVDVERGGQAAMPTRTQVEHVTGAFAIRYAQITGVLPTLYGGSLFRTLGIRDRLHCGRSAVAYYSERLGGAEGTASFLARTGTDLAHALWWQYRGTSEQTRFPAGYPWHAPGVAHNVDVNALIWPDGLRGLQRALAADGRAVPPTDA